MLNMLALTILVSGLGRAVSSWLAQPDYQRDLEAEWRQTTRTSPSMYLKLEMTWTHCYTVRHTKRTAR